MRVLAVNALEEMARTSRRADDAILAAIGPRTLSPPDRALIKEIVLGVTRRRITIDRILASFSRVKMKKVHVRVIQAMRIAVYQLIWLDRIPPAAAVNESVKVVKYRFPGWTVKYANGCLRAISRAIDMKVAGPLSPEDLARAVPISGERNCLFEIPLFPECDAQPVAAAALRHGYPEWFVARCRIEFDKDTVNRILRAGNEPPSIWLRPSPDRLLDLEARLRRRRIAFEIEERPPVCVHLTGSPGAVEDLPGYRRGWFVVQDRSAMLAAPFLKPGPGDRVLDLCAAPGGKTTHLAQMVGPGGAVVAVDREPGRLAKIAENAKRLALGNISLVCADARNPAAELGTPYSHVLVDVPCSNTGVLAKRAEARHRLDTARIESLVGLQRDILRAGIRRLAPGGALVYSTCSILPEENRDLVAAVAAEEGLRIEEENLSLPLGGQHDGSYLARLRSGERGALA